MHAYARKTKNGSAESARVNKCRSLVLLTEPLTIPLIPLSQNFLKGFQFNQSVTIDSLLDKIPGHKFLTDDFIDDMITSKYYTPPGPYLRGGVWGCDTPPGKDRVGKLTKIQMLSANCLKLQ